MWAELYGTVATSPKEVLRDKALLKEKVWKHSEAKDKHLKKLAGELEVCQGNLQAIQHSYMERGTAIDNLEALVAGLSVKPSNVTNPHISGMHKPSENRQRPQVEHSGLYPVLLIRIPGNALWALKCSFILPGYDQGGFV